MLDETPSRALALLRALGTSKPIRAQLASRGYSTDDHTEGWKLLSTASGHAMAAEAAVEEHNPARQAIRELDAWDERGFRLARAALRRLHPAQEAFVFENLTASQGAQAVLGIVTFLNRLDSLESGVERKATRRADRAALDTLARRGVTTVERERLRALVIAAQSSPEISDADLEGDAAATTAKAKRDVELANLRAWYEDWAATARSVVTRRDYLIRLGLAKRRSARKSAALGPRV
jgi:hypothetical protein